MTLPLVEQLKADLWEQWISAHAEHCDWWPHLEEHECYWPMPESLAGYKPKVNP